MPLCSGVSMFRDMQISNRAKQEFTMAASGACKGKLPPPFSPITQLSWITHTVITQTTRWLSQPIHTIGFQLSETVLVAGRFTLFFSIWQFYQLLFYWPAGHANHNTFSLYRWFIAWNYHLNCSWVETDLGWVCQLSTTHIVCHINVAQ